MPRMTRCGIIPVLGNFFIRGRRRRAVLLRLCIIYIYIKLHCLWHATEFFLAGNGAICSHENMSRTLMVVYLFAASFMCCAMIWYAVYYAEAQRNLAIHFFDVGQGDGIFFELPNHVQVLIDGGPGSGILAKLGNVMPFWDHTIDLVVLTHPHVDHLDGLIDVLKRYDVGMVIESGVSYATPDYDEWNRLLAQKNVHVVYAHAGQHVALSDIAALDILYPMKDLVGAKFSNVHDSMIVSKLSYGLSTVLFMGDAERLIEYRLMGVERSLVSDVLKVGHHGSKTSTTQGFLDMVSPRFAVISVGRKNRYGHPHQEVVDRIQSLGITLFRTDINGDVEFISDGTRIDPQ